MSFNAGDKVYLNAKNIKSMRPSKKLDYKYYGPYVIEKPVGKQAYKLKLPANMGKIHNVFHVSLLEPFKGGDRGDDEPPPIELDGEDQWEIQEILDSKIYYDKLQYYVTWLGYPSTDDQWLSEHELQNARELIEQFHQRYPGKPGPGDVQRKKRRRG